MGVRFQCPHGHKLHVKAELAGKRGICPECGAKFIVPAFNGGRVAVDESAAQDPPPLKGREQPSTGAPKSPERRAVVPGEAIRGGIESAPPAPAVSTSLQAASNGPADSVLIPTQPPPIAAPPAPSDAKPPTPEPIAWYVRPAAGGQFGPATTEVFQQWIEDGRVAVDSWVWRTGWPDWKAGGEALAQIPDRPSLEPGASIAATQAAPVVSSDALVGAAAQIEPASADIRRAEIKRRKDRVRKLSTILALVALAMLMALVFVLAR